MIKWSPEWFRYNIKNRSYPIWIEFIPGSTEASLAYTEIIKEQLQRIAETYGLEDCIESKDIISISDTSKESAQKKKSPNDEKNDVSDINLEENEDESSEELNLERIEPFFSREDLKWDSIKINHKGSYSYAIIKFKNDISDWDDRKKNNYLQDLTDSLREIAGTPVNVDIYEGGALIINYPELGNVEFLRNAFKQKGLKIEPDEYLYEPYLAEKNEDKNYYMNWLRNAVNEVTKGVTDSKSKVIITDSGLLNLLISLYYDYYIGSTGVSNVREDLFSECKNGVHKQNSLGNDVFYRLIADTFEFDISEMQNISGPDEFVKMTDSIDTVLKLIQKLSFSLQYSPITFVVGDNFRITDVEIEKGKKDDNVFENHDKEELDEESYGEISFWDEEYRDEEFDDNDYIENDERRTAEYNNKYFGNCMRTLEPDFREISQKICYLNREYSLDEVMSKIIEQIYSFVYFQGKDSILVDTPFAEGRHTVLFGEPNEEGKITELIDVENKRQINAKSLRERKEKLVIDLQNEERDRLKRISEYKKMILNFGIIHKDRPPF